MNTENEMKGMPMFAPGDPEQVRKEQEELKALKSKGSLARMKWYLSKSGPGWMQSAMTLGGGSAMASLFSGALLGFQLLWVQPVAMLIGIVMLSALAYQTLHTGMKPFQAMKTFLSPAMAYTWAIATLLATIIWHFSQYALLAGMVEDILSVTLDVNLISGSTEQTLLLIGIGCIVLFFAIRVSWNYGNGSTGIKAFEKIIKVIIWFIIFAFATVVIVCAFSENGIKWGDVFSGFLPFTIDSTGFQLQIPSVDSSGFKVFTASLSAAVGINMTFLFGYTFLAKGWKKEHAGLAQFDMFTGMLLPYTLATSLMIIAAGATLHTNPEIVANLQNGGSISPIECAGMLEHAGLPTMVAHLLFGLGIIGMTFNAIVLHMLVCGFAACEMFEINPQGWKYKLATLIPTPGFLGVILWSKIGTWIAIPTSAMSLVFLPIAYIGFFLLHNNRKFLGNAMPVGRKRYWWNAAMIISIGIIIACAIVYLKGLFV